MLPYIGLKGNGVAIGRGKEALWAVAGGTSSPSSPRTCLAHGNSKEMQVGRRSSWPAARLQGHTSHTASATRHVVASAVNIACTVSCQASS